MKPCWTSSESMKAPATCPESLTPVAAVAVDAGNSKVCTSPLLIRKPTIVCFSVYVPETKEPEPLMPYTTGSPDGGCVIFLYFPWL